MKKIISIITICCIIFGFGIGLEKNALAQNGNQGIVVSTSGEVNSNDLVQPNASAVGIFVAGVLVGYVVDGVIQYATGYSAAYWISLGLSNMETKIKNYVKSYKPVQLHVSRDGTLKGCVTFPCAIQSSIPTYE